MKTRSLREIDFDIHYEGTASYLNAFLIPALGEGISYKRATGYFNIESLISVSQGLETLLLSGGQMQLLIGLHDLSEELLLAQKASNDPPSLRNETSARLEEIVQEIGSLGSALKLRRLETLTSMISGGHLKIKLARPLGVSSQHIFHVKRFVIEDSNGDFVCATGSPNETLAGVEGNFEEISTFKSWEDLSGHAHELRRKFDSLWSGHHPNLEVMELAQADWEVLKDAVSASLRNIGINPDSERKSRRSFIESLKEFVPGKIFQFKGARLYPHQEYAYLKALSRWPVRVLLADEVGLGKTLEIGSILKYMQDVAGLKSGLFLAPKNVVSQLQSELFEKFGLDFLVWNSGRQTYHNSRGEALGKDFGPPGSPNAPDWIIASSQWARGSGLRSHIFVDMEKIPDVLIVDEAHAARVPAPNQNSSPSLLHRALLDASNKIQHIILMTATPMQLHVSEYHGLLQILGLPKTWQKLSKFELGIMVQANEHTAMSLNDAKDLALLLSEAASLVPTEESSEESSSTEKLIQFANNLRKTWPENVERFIRLNPASQLTVRNTRGSLEKFGYKFPERNFISPQLTEPLSLSEIRFSLDEYLSSAYGKFEELLNSDKKPNGRGFVASIYEQRFASSLWALRSSLERRRLKLESIYFNSPSLVEFDDDDLLEETEEPIGSELPSSFSLTSLLKASIQNEINFITDIVNQIDAFDNGPINGDPKLAEVRRLILESLNQQKHAIVFSRYTDTLSAILEGVSKDPTFSHASFGYYTGQDCWVQINGFRSLITKSQLQKALANREIGFVLCSDAASEGINLQTASVLINVDVPWNPGRLEQRIGRIARLGQKADVVDIANLWYPNSVESVMYGRLLERKELYDLAVGAFPELFARGIREMVSMQSGARMSFSGDVFEKLEDLRAKCHLDGLQRLWESDLTSVSKSSVIWGSLREAVHSLGFDIPDNEGLNFDVFRETTSKFGDNHSNAALYRKFNEFGTWGYEVVIDNGGDRINVGLVNLAEFLKYIFGQEPSPKLSNDVSDSDWVPRHGDFKLTSQLSSAWNSLEPNMQNLQLEEIGRIKISNED